MPEQELQAKIDGLELIVAGYKQSLADMTRERDALQTKIKKAHDMIDSIEDDAADLRRFTERMD